MSQSRQLAAIMFTDIVGYTALMGTNEQKAFEILKKNREIHQSIIETYNGKLIKELGDGILASFPTVSDALFAAIKIQQTCSLSKDLSLRIGIHEGEIIFENNDIYGDAVNIASRLQTLGVPGWGWLLAGGILLVILAFVILYYPAAGAISIVAYSASAFFVAGIFNIILAFKFKTIKKDVKGFEGRLKHAAGLQ